VRQEAFEIADYARLVGGGEMSVNARILTVLHAELTAGCGWDYHDRALPMVGRWERSGVGQRTADVGDVRRAGQAGVAGEWQVAEMAAAHEDGYAKNRQFPLLEDKRPTGRCM